VLVALAAASVGGAALAIGLGSPASLEGSIRVEAAHIGPSPLLIPVGTEIPIVNASRSRVAFRVEPSCGCTSVEPRRLELGSGERGALAVRIDGSELARRDMVSVTLVGEGRARGEMVVPIDMDWVWPLESEAAFAPTLTLPLRDAYAGHTIDGVTAYRNATNEEIPASMTEDGRAVELWPPPGTRSVDVVLRCADFDGGKVVQRVSLDRGGRDEHVTGDSRDSEEDSS
jgi:hypothetical protein